MAIIFCVSHFNISPPLLLFSVRNRTLCCLFRTIGFFFSKILHLCHLGVTKSACPTTAEKCLSTAICPYSRWRSQPLSRVSRKQRYNTLDFAEQIVCQGGRCPLWIPLPRATLFPFGYPMPTGMLSPLLDDPEPKGGRCPPLEISRIFCVREYPNCKITAGIPRLENKKGQNLIPRIG